MARITGQKKQPRTLLYFPIIHNLADMGALSDSVRLASLKKLGRSGWNRKIGLIDKFWTENSSLYARIQRRAHRMTRAKWLDDPVRTTSRTDCASLDLGQELLLFSNRSNTAGKVVRVSGTAANMPMIMAKPRNSRE